MKPANFTLSRPTQSAEAVHLLVQSEGLGKALSGGQSLGPMMNMRLVQPASIIDLSLIEDLRQSQDAIDYVSLGAAVTHSNIEDQQVPDPTGGLMREVAAGIAYRAIRNRGTLGGSLAHADPAADWVNLLALLNASFVVLGPNGVREVEATDWMQAAFTTSLTEAEILLSVRIPRLSSHARRSYYKINRKPGEFADAIAGFVEDPVRQVYAGVIGALDAPPLYIHDARALIQELRTGLCASLTHSALLAAGLEPDTHAYQLHAVALLRAVALLDSDSGKMQ